MKHMSPLTFLIHRVLFFSEKSGYFCTFFPSSPSFCPPCILSIHVIAGDDFKLLMNCRGSSSSPQGLFRSFSNITLSSRAQRWFLPALIQGCENSSLWEGVCFSIKAAKTSGFSIHSGRDEGHSGFILSFNLQPVQSTLDKTVELFFGHSHCKMALSYIRIT